MLVIFSAVVLIAHMSACMWIFLGHVEDWKDEDERHTWRFNKSFGEDFKGYNRF